MQTRAKDRGASANRTAEDSRASRAELVRFALLICVSALVAIATSAWYASRQLQPPGPALTVSSPGQVPAADPSTGTAQPARAARRASVWLPESTVPVAAEPLQAEAEEVAGQLLARFPELPEALHVAALLHARLRQTERAEKLWKKCVELAPTTEQYRVNLAAIAMDRGNNELAAATLRPIVAAGKSSADATHHLALALSNLGDNDEAERILAQALARHPGSPAHHQVLGRVRLKLGKLAEAEADLRRALELGARSADLFFALGNACARQGNGEDAAEFRRQFSAMKAGEPLAAQERYQVLSTAEARQTALTVLVEAATVHVDQKDSQEAERLLLRALAIDPGNVAACRSLAELYAGEGMLPEQRVVAERLVQIDPLNVHNYAMLAELADELDEPAAAEAALKQAISVHPDFAPAYTALARFYVEQARPSKARWYAQEALRRHETVQGYELLATTCRLLGDERTAAAAQAKSKELAVHKLEPGPPEPAESQSAAPEKP